MAKEKKASPKKHIRYMVYIWEDYEKEMEKKKKGISKTKDFRYPPILPSFTSWYSSERLSQLAKVLFEQKRLEDLERAMYDSEYREGLYREFHI